MSTFLLVLVATATGVLAVGVIAGAVYFAGRLFSHDTLLYIGLAIVCALGAFVIGLLILSVLGMVNPKELGF